MTTIYVDSRKRVAGSDSDFEVDLGESLHLQSDARLAVYKMWSTLKGLVGEAGGARHRMSLLPS